MPAYRSCWGHSPSDSKTLALTERGALRDSPFCEAEPRCSPRRADVRPTAQQGVFDVSWGMRDIRLILLSRIAKHQRNAPWELFSFDLDRIRQGARHIARDTLAPRRCFTSAIFATRWS